MDPREEAIESVRRLNGIHVGDGHAMHPACVVMSESGNSGLVRCECGVILRAVIRDATAPAPDTRHVYVNDEDPKAVE